MKLLNETTSISEELMVSYLEKLGKHLETKYPNFEYLFHEGSYLWFNTTEDEDFSILATPYWEGANGIKIHYNNGAKITYGPTVSFPIKDLTFDLKKDADLYMKAMKRYL